MARPHPALLDLVCGRPMRAIQSMDELIASSVEHGLNGLLWTHLQGAPLRLNSKQARRLAALDLRTQASHERLTSVLLELQVRMRSLGVDPISLKGVTAEARWYDRTGERPCTDVDILVPANQLGRVPELVYELQPNHPLASSVDRLVGSGQIQSIVLEVDGVSVDLHFDLLKLGVRSRIVIDRRAGTEVLRLLGDETTHVLTPEPALALFLMHLYKDNFAYLRNYLDVLRVLQREDMDWGQFRAMGEADQISGLLTLSLMEVSRVLAGPSHEDASPPSRALATAIAALWPRGSRLMGHKGFLSWTSRWRLLPLLSSGVRSEAVGHLVHHMFPPPEVIDYNLPGRTGPYLWRLLSGRTLAFRSRREATRALAATGRRP